MTPSFSIKDLENISGIKAHTIRIWEKRYHLLDPQRTSTNIRSYSLENLQKLLNVAYLIHHGYKISRVSKLNTEEITTYTSKIVSEKSIAHRAINTFKIAMLNYDLSLFLETYNTLHLKNTFRQICYDVFIPLLNHIGLLWQTNTITPSHEHFITNLITQKLILNIEKLQQLEPTKTSRTFILFLPKNETHELGLQLVNYELLLNGYKTIYLGANIPLDNLPPLMSSYSNATFVSYFTIAPKREKIVSYLSDFTSISKNKHELWIFGQQLNVLNDTPIEEIKPHRFFDSIEALVPYL